MPPELLPSIAAALVRVQLSQAPSLKEQAAVRAAVALVCRTFAAAVHSMPIDATQQVRMSNSKFALVHALLSC